MRLKNKTINSKKKKKDIYTYKITLFFPFFFHRTVWEPGSADEHGEEVRGEVLPARLAPSLRPALAVEREEHGAAPVPPAQRRVGVVAVLLDALLELAVGAELLLAGEGRG